MSTRRKLNSRKPGSTRHERVAQPEPLSFEARLAHYASHPAAKKNQRPDGLSGPQYKRLIKKYHREHTASE